MNPFKNIAKDLLLEREGGFSKCSTQANLKEGRNAVLKLANLVPDDHLHEHGRENEPHVTVLYGITPSLTALKDVEGAVHKSGLTEIKATMGNCSLFTNEEFDVVKFEVISEDLHKLNRTICETVPYESNFPDYNPHITVAYVKPGLGQQYVDRIGQSLAGIPLRFNAIQFSNVDGTKTPIELGYPDNEGAKHPDTGDMNEDLGVGGGFHSGGNQGMGYTGGHQGVFNSPQVGAQADKYRNYKRYTMMGNNTVVTSGYYDTVFDADVAKIMSLLKDLGFKTKGMPSNDDETEHHLKNIDTQSSGFKNPNDNNVSSTDDVMDDTSGINLTRDTVLNYLKAEFGAELPDLIKQNDGKIGYDEIMLGLKEVMRNMKYPDKDFAFVEVLKKLIREPDHYSGLKKYGIDEQSYERSIYGTKFKPNEISNILKEFK